MPKIVIITGNVHKVEEINAIWRDCPYEIVPITSVMETVPEIVEDGDTFLANALKKLNALPAHPERIYMAEDSGIEVAALDGRPGIHSARYGGDGISTIDQCRLLLSELDGQSHRRANYTCVAVLKFPDGTVIDAEGKWFGTIALDLKGTHGFGYDPIFIPDGYDVTSASLSPDEKNAISHRRLALDLLKKSEQLSGFR